MTEWFRQRKDVRIYLVSFVVFPASINRTDFENISTCFTQIHRNFFHMEFIEWVELNICRCRD